MTLKTARTKLRLTDIESLTQAGRARAREAANEAGSRNRNGAAGRSAFDATAGRTVGRSSAKEGDAMPYRDSGSDPTIGQELTEARQAAGLEIADVAAQLRIRKEFLAALEEGRPDVLPGTTYAIGYVRTYAAFLGLDVERAVTRFKQEAAGLDQRTQLVFPSPAPEGRVPGVGLMFASVLLAGLAYGGWYWLSERGMSVYDMVPDVPERLATLIEGQNPPTTLPPATGPSTAVPATESVASAPPSTAPASATDSAYTAANPTSVPVTARSTSGEAATASVSPTSGTQTSDLQPAPATEPAAPAPVSAITRPTTDAPAAQPAPVAPVTVTAAPAPDSSVASIDTVVPAAPAADTAEDTPAADPEPSATALASAAPAPTQALAAARPLAPAPSGNAVPTAPRLSGLIGASEAAVPGTAANPVPAAIERVVVRATGESWVQVRSQDGTTLFTRVLRNGDVYRVPDRSGLTLATGNAGALEIVVDGKPTPSLGTFGEVVRNIALDPDRLTEGTAVAGRN